jgi:hypothetical protein
MKNECGVVLFGCHETANQLNKDSGGYENVSVLEPIQRPSVISLPAKLDQVEVREREDMYPRSPSKHIYTFTPPLFQPSNPFAAFFFHGVVPSCLKKKNKIGTESGDLIDGLVVAVDALHRRVGKLKFVKTVYLITAAEDRIESPGDLEATVGGV